MLDLLQSLKDAFDKNEIPYLGFIYAYNDKDYVYKYFLVDGQQRMTTIFLLLLALHQKMNKKLPEYILKESKMKLDYKVRQATHDFLTDLVSHCGNNFNDYNFSIKNQVWFHKEYEIDKTISNMVENYNAIREWLMNIETTKTVEFLKFIEDSVQLSYFDIDNGRQGEELYIYMNSRGRQLEPNETLKAKYLSDIKIQNEKEERGKQWENWQDFFWKHRGIRADADSGFNDFLQLVQIINMCALGKSTDEISDYASGKSNQVPVFDLLPQSFEELEKYFESFKWFVNSDRVSNFFKEYEDNENFFSSSSSIDLRRKQIYYFRILPVITLLANTELKDEEVLIRFIRFFYNLSRKDSSIGKDISQHLPNAIKLMLEYGINNKKKKFDVCDLIAYQKGRTVLINDEEVLKLNLYKSPPQSTTRKDIENLFWKAEDHFVFKGEIGFLLFNYFNKSTNQFDFKKYINTWTVFENIFTKKKENNTLVSRALLYYGNTWVQDTPYYYFNYDCQDWHTLVRVNSGKHLLEFLEDLHGRSLDFIDEIIKKRAKKYFVQNNFTSISSIKAVDTLFDQIKILATIDYYTDKLIWSEGGYIAIYDDRFTSQMLKDPPFFNDRVIFNVSRYIGDGEHGRIIPMMSDVLKNQNKLTRILKEIVS